MVESKRVGKVIFNSGPLHDQTVFRWSIFIMTSVLLFVWLFSLSDKSFDFSALGMRRFLGLSKDLVPFVALSVAVIALLARMHATVQAHERMVMDKEVNAYNGYLAHRKYISEAVEDFEHIIFDKNAVDKSFLYRKVFPGNGPRYFSPVYREGNVLEKVGERAFSSLKMDLHEEEGPGLDEWEFRPNNIVVFMSTFLREVGVEPSMHLREIVGKILALEMEWDEDSLSGFINYLASFRKLIGDIDFLADQDSDGLTQMLPMIYTLKNHNWKVRRSFWENNWPEFLS